MADNVYNDVIAALVHVTIKRGDAAVFTIPLYDPNNNNDPVDLSVYTSFVAQIKVDDGRETSIIELGSTVAAGATFEIVRSTNELTFTLLKAKTEVKRGKYVWDVEGIGGPQDPKTLIEGDFEVSQDVTRIVTP